MRGSEYARSLNVHYGRPDLGASILAGLQAAGRDPNALTLDDLAPVDHFHIRGKEATVALARLAGLQRGMNVLDVGGGIGGPARTLVRELGCRVTVLDIVEEYCRVGEDLTRRTGMGHQVAFQQGNALEMPFPDGTFDAVWSQHSTMNIEDKERLYRETHRVLRAGGRLAFHEIVAGSRAPIRFPVPWAREASTSFLRPADALRTLVAGKGFREITWRDVSGSSLEWFRQRVAAAERAQTPPPLGLHLLLGPEFGAMFKNQVRNLEEDRIAVIKGVWERP
jgi:SAM-dependent methyltransferase